MSNGSAYRTYIIEQIEKNGSDVQDEEFNVFT